MSLESLRDAALDLHSGDAISRERWANTCAAVLANLPMEVIHTMAAEGFRKFQGVVTPIWRGHAFTTDDLRRIFAVIKRTSELNARIDPRLILADGERH